MFVLLSGMQNSQAYWCRQQPNKPIIFHACPLLKFWAGLLKGVSKEDLLKGVEGFIQVVAKAVAARVPRSRQGPFEQG
uniref:Uncharacterized protein n=1 Tax=Arundo donax TaxID=35708 RepID=A0A0A8YKZ2_ARUDO